jgi:pyridoxal 5'-phosphate synthase pdxT subunit
MTLEEASGARTTASTTARTARPRAGEAPAAAREPAPLLVGVLALQGDFAAHAAALTRGGAQVREVRRAAELAGCDALVLPGGESTTLLRLLHAFELWDPLREFAAGGRALLGTCAGLILCAQEVLGPPQASLGLLPVTVVRNAYGRQVDSRVAEGRVRVPAGLRRELGGSESFATDFVFIRSPRVTRAAPEVEILADHEGDPVLVRHGAILAASFHPELSSDGRVIGLFLALAGHARERGTSPR